MDLNALRAYEYPYRGTHFKHIRSVPLREIIAPSGQACMHGGAHIRSVPLREIIAPSGQACMHGGAHIRSVPLREIFFLRAPSGPLMGTLWAPMWAPSGAPTFSKNIIN